MAKITDSKRLYTCGCYIDSYVTKLWFELSPWSISDLAAMGIYAQSGLRVITVVKGPFRGKACRNALNRGNGPAGPAKSSYKWKNHMYIHTTYNSNQAHQLRRFWCACMYSPYNSYTCSITGCALFDGYLPICLQDNEFN